MNSQQHGHTPKRVNEPRVAITNRSYEQHGHTPTSVNEPRVATANRSYEQNGHTPTRVGDSATPKPGSWRPSRWYLPIGGALALAWFLIRVIPKPSRASYPCQRAAFPIATGFIVWLLSGWGTLLAFRKARQRFALPFVVLAIIAGTAFFLNQPILSILGQGAPQTQPVFSPTEPVNAPMGAAFGIKPGRVAWAHDSKATSWDGTTNAPGWWDDSNTHPQAVSALLSAVIRSVGDAPSDKDAWNKIFTDFNKRSGKGAVGYKKGEKIAIKLNLNQCRNHDDGANASYIAPQLVEALLKQLVTDAGVAPADITFYDAIRNVPSTIFNRCTKTFPGVHFVDSIGGDGREKAVRAESSALNLAPGGNPIYFPTCVTEASYLINVAGLKGHTMAGITVCAKNHLGSIFTPEGTAAARSLHSTIAVKAGRGGMTPQQMGSYNSLVDLNGHKELGGKTVLYLIDGLYATKHNEYRLDPTCKWESAPFNGHWTSMLLAAQDGIAIDSVALDFMRNEPTLSAIVTGAVDNYLHEAAQANKAPSKTVYDPEKDGKPLASHGIHEHWNNAAEKKYSRNLGTGTGIELVSVRMPSTVASDQR